MDGRAVDAVEVLPAHGEEGSLDRPLGTGFTGTVALDFEHLGAVEERGVEAHRLLGGSVNFTCGVTCLEMRSSSR